MVSYENFLLQIQITLDLLVQISVELPTASLMCWARVMTESCVDMLTTVDGSMAVSVPCHVSYCFHRPGFTVIDDHFCPQAE